MASFHMPCKSLPVRHADKNMQEEIRYTVRIDFGFLIKWYTEYAECVLNVT